MHKIQEIIIKEQLKMANLCKTIYLKYQANDNDFKYT